MKCLAVNTATSITSIAVLDGEKVLHFFSTPEMRNQGNMLIGRIEIALKESNIGFRDLDLLAAVTGPGSFTGIRVGLAALRGIALASNKPLAGISSFELFAVPAAADSINVVAVQSWRDELYFAVFDSNGQKLMEDANETPAGFATRFTRAFGGRQVIVSGDAAGALTPLLQNAAQAGACADAVHLGALSMSRHLAGAGSGQETAMPYYLREADVTLPSKQG